MKTILVYGLKNVIGGIENYLMTMYSYLHNKMKFIFIVEKADTFIYERRIKELNGEIVFLPEHHELLLYKKTLSEVLKKYKLITDTLYVNVGHISFDIIPIKMALSAGYRVVTHSHSAMQEPIKRLRYRFRQDILRSFAMISLRRLTLERLAVSERAGLYLYGNLQFTIVSPGIEVSKFKYNPEIRTRIRERYSLINCNVIGFVGRLVPVKNPLFLLDVLYDTRRSIPNLKLLLVGDGDLKNDIMQRAISLNLEKEVVFVGEVENAQDYYQAMDVLLAPSLSEGMPLGIMEAQSAGVPCICAKNNFPETIDVTGTVYFCSLQNGTEVWSNKVRELLSKNIDRGALNKVVRESELNIVNASKHLFEILE